MDQEHQQGSSLEGSTHNQLITQMDTNTGDWTLDTTTTTSGRLGEGVRKSFWVYCSGLFNTNTHNDSKDTLVRTRTHYKTETHTHHIHIHKHSIQDTPTLTTTHGTLQRSTPPDRPAWLEWESSFIKIRLRGKLNSGACRETAVIQCHPVPIPMVS